jgi:hypothetical protein
MVSGEAGVTNRIRLSGPVGAYLTIAGFVVLVTTFNIFTALHDAAEARMKIAAWEPAVWEYTSGASTLITCAIIYVALRVAPPARTHWPRFVAVHAIATVLFSALHVLLMNAMRVAIYASIGRQYQFGEAGFLYEYRKDLIAYLVWAGIFWLFTMGPVRRPNVPVSTGRPTIDIRDGKRLLRVRIDEVAAVRAAGNYVEFMLTDGRRPLARKSLAEAHRELGEFGFVRTHRSWMINAAHVRELRATGAGDYDVALDGGIESPLSRRFPDALSKLLNRESDRLR